MDTSWSCRSWPNVMYGVFPLDDDECDEEDVDIILQGKKMEATKNGERNMVAARAHDGRRVWIGCQRHSVTAARCTDVQSL